MKNLIVTMGMLVFIASSNASATTDIQSAGHTTTIFSSDSLFIIAFSDNSQAQQTIAALSSAGVLGVSPVAQILLRGFCILRRNPSLAVEQAVAAAMSVPNVICAKPLDEDEYGRPYNILDDVIIRYRSNSYAEVETALANEYGLVLIDSMITRKDTKVYSVGRGSCDQTVTISNAINADARVLWASPSFTMAGEQLFLPNDTLFGLQWYFRNTGQNQGKPDADIDLDSAWEVKVKNRPNFGDTSVVVALIDDGLTLYNYNNLLFPPLPAHWDHGGILIKSPYDFAGNDIAHAYPPDKYPDPGPRQAHGTMCTGLIAGETNDTYGLAGISKFCTMIPIKTWDDSGLAAPIYRFVDAIRWAVDSGAMIINCSWSLPYYHDIVAAICRGVDTNPHGFSCLFVCAAGNAGVKQLVFPAYLENVLAVGATDKNDVLWYWSDHANELDVVAPAGNADVYFADMLTTDQIDYLGWNPYVTGDYPNEYPGFNWTRKFGGTSAAAAEVTGIAALILARRPDFIGPDLYDSVKYVLEGSAQDQVGDAFDTPGWDEFYGHGRVNAYRALLSVIRGDVNNDGTINALDVVQMVNYVYASDPSARPRPERCVGDCNCDGAINPIDIVYLVGHVYQGRPRPVICFNYAP